MDDNNFTDTTLLLANLLYVFGCLPKGVPIPTESSPIFKSLDYWIRNSYKHYFLIDNVVPERLGFRIIKHSDRALLQKYGYLMYREIDEYYVFDYINIINRNNVEDEHTLSGLLVSFAINGRLIIEPYFVRMNKEYSAYFCKPFEQSYLFAEITKAFFNAKLNHYLWEHKFKIVEIVACHDSIY